MNKLCSPNLEKGETCLQVRGVKIKKRLGQNFLQDESALKKIVEVAEIQPGDQVVEIGAGTGNLTFYLALTGAKILALEKDRDLIARLTRRLKRFKNVKIIQRDARFFSFNFDTANAPTPAVPSSAVRYKVVANLPYNISSYILRQLLTQKNQPQLMVLMLQKEVAEKIIAAPGASDRGLLTILVKLVSKPRIIFSVSRDKFSPQPKVDSAVVRIVPFKKWDNQTEKLLKFIKICFSAKRRQLKNNLKTLLADQEKLYNVFNQSGINPTWRAEDLSIYQWKNFYAAYQKTITKSGKISPK